MIGYLSGIVKYFGLLRSRFAFVIAVAMLPAGVVAILQAVANTETTEQVRHETLANEVRLRASDERDLLVEVRETLRSVGRTALRELETTGTCDSALSDEPELHAWMSRILVLDDTGSAICGVSEPFSVSEMPAWREDYRRAPRFTLGAVRSSRLSGEEIIVAFLPISSVGDEVITIATGVKIASLRRLSNRVEAGQRPFALVGNRGKAVINRNSDNDDWLPQGMETTLGPGTSLVRRSGLDGILRNYITYPLVPGEIWAITGEEREQLSQLVFSRAGLPIVMPIVLWLIAVSVAFVAIDRMVTRHVKHLRNVANAIGAGHFDTPVRSLEGAPTEIEMLGKSIGQMAGNLSERETRLRELLSTQKSLLLEVHHRVKNNLQMISSLMNIQMRRASSDLERGTLQMMQDRIHGLALVHQNLYATERLDKVALEQLVRDVSNHLSTSLRPINSTIEMNMDLDSVSVDAAVGTPVALFVTEAMGNVFKHATRPGARTLVDISLKEDGSIFELAITNARFPDRDQVEDRGPSGLGNRLMEGFARQLNGTLTWVDEPDKFGVTLVAPIEDHSKDFELRSPKVPEVQEV